MLGEIQLPPLTLTLGFWITLALLVLLWMLVTLMTLGGDAILIGFPLPFYAMGGQCVTSCEQAIAWPIALFDLIALLGLPGLVNWMILYRRRKEAIKHKKRRKTDRENRPW